LKALAWMRAPPASAAAFAVASSSDAFQWLPSYEVGWM
jgi:hypothetical protein